MKTGATPISKPATMPPRSLLVTEGIAGTYHYHLAFTGDTRALCGARVMHTSVPLTAWSYRGHLNEHYCATCAEHPEGAAALCQVPGAVVTPRRATQTTQTKQTKQKTQASQKAQQGAEKNVV